MEKVSIFKKDAEYVGVVLRLPGSSSKMAFYKKANLKGIADYIIENLGCAPEKEEIKSELRNGYRSKVLEELRRKELCTDQKHY